MVSTDKTEAVIGAPSAAQVEVADARLVIGQGIGPEVKMLYVVSLISSARGKADAIHRKQATEVNEKALAIALATYKDGFATANLVIRRFGVPIAD